MAAFLATASNEQVRTAMVHYSFLVQAYVWGEAEAPTTLPANLAIPICAIGDDLALDPGIGNCGKAGQWVPVGVGQPTILIGGLTVGGSAA